MPHLTLTKEHIFNAIIAPEIGSAYYNDLRLYNSKYHRPNYPGGGSGITCGIGYDLGTQTVKTITNDWKGLVSDEVLNFFISCSGKLGATATASKLAAAKIISVPYEVAYKVFTTKTLPRFCKLALDTFPGLDLLNPLAQAIIVGIVYNRGGSLTDSSEDAKKERRREEMRDLVPAIAKADYITIAAEIKSMQRLWDGIPDFEGDKETRLGGLVTRREKEAKDILASVGMVFKDEDKLLIEC